jgi:hypothetical protein
MFWPTKGKESRGEYLLHLFEATLLSFHCFRKFVLDYMLEARKIISMDEVE